MTSQFSINCWDSFSMSFWQCKHICQSYPLSFIQSNTSIMRELSTVSSSFQQRRIQWQQIQPIRPNDNDNGFRSNCHKDIYAQSDPKVYSLSVPCCVPGFTWHLSWHTCISIQKQENYKKKNLKEGGRGWFLVALFHALWFPLMGKHLAFIKQFSIIVGGGAYLTKINFLKFFRCFSQGHFSGWREVWGRKDERGIEIQLFNHTI